MYKLYNYKLIFDAVYCVRNHEDLYETMAKQCNNSEMDCTVGFLKCPFDKNCKRITKDDWAKILIPSTMENSNEQMDN